MKPRIKSSYIARCKDYLHWLSGPLFVLDESLPDTAIGEYTAVEAMFMQETHGRSVSCSEPRMFDALYKGKQCREFKIKQWMSGVKAKEFWPEEFLGCSGLRSVAEFRSIFGRGPTLPLLRRILREVDRELEELTKSENSISVSASCAASLRNWKPNGRPV